METNYHRIISKLKKFGFKDLTQLNPDRVYKMMTFDLNEVESALDKAIWRFSDRPCKPDQFTNYWYACLTRKDHERQT